MNQIGVDSAKVASKPDATTIGLVVVTGLLAFFGYSFLAGEESDQIDQFAEQVTQLEQEQQTLEQRLEAVSREGADERIAFLIREGQRLDTMLPPNDETLTVRDFEIQLQALLAEHHIVRAGFTRGDASTNPDGGIFIPIRVSADVDQSGLEQRWRRLGLRPGVQGPTALEILSETLRERDARQFPELARTGLVTIQGDTGDGALAQDASDDTVDFTLQMWLTDQQTLAQQDADLGLAPPVSGGDA